MWRKLFGRKKGEENAEAAEVAQQSPSALECESTETGGSSQEPKTSLFGRLKEGLSKTRAGFVGRIEDLMKGRRIDETLFEELEEILVRADVGVATAMELVNRLRERAETERLTDGDELRPRLEEEIRNILTLPDGQLTLSGRPAVIMVAGVNGVGKTTTIGKLAYRLRRENAKVIVGAADTFRAAAIDQLSIWAQRVQVDIIAHNEGSDPAAVAFDTLAAARARQADAVIVDTAGRLQTKTNLMAELGKVHRVLRRELGHDLDEVLLVVDATTGQNAMSQARIFSDAIPVTGIVLTKLDGTAKGGIVLALAHELQIPVKLVGVGETYEDLQDFDPEEFTRALFL